jgi:soluble lytic murein transglycosylase-like protein
MNILNPSREEIVTLAKEAAVRHGLAPALVCAMIEQESNFDPWAYRYEQGFYYKYVVPLHLSTTESMARSTSWGLLQVMGQSARELGFKGWLTKLCDPETGIEIGCQWFKVKLAKAAGDLNKALLYWNGSSEYPQQVLNRVSKFEAVCRTESGTPSKNPSQS